MRDALFSLVIAVTVLVAGAALALVMGMPIAGTLVMAIAGLAAAIVSGVNRTVPQPQPGPQFHATEPLAIYKHPEFSDFFDAMATPMLMVNDGQVRAANRAARALLGNFIVGSDVRTAIRHPAAADRLANPRSQGKGSVIDLVGMGRPGQRWEMRTMPLADGSRLVLLTDQTARDAVERMRADFVANASHELRTPLAAILGFIETLSDTDAGDDKALRQRFLGVIDTESRRMLRLVEDLLSISRIEAIKHRPPDDPVDLAELIGDVVDEIAASGDPRAADLQFDPGPPIPEVLADRVQLSQLLHNIIGNAMKYGRAGTPVTVALVPHSIAMVRLTVTDRGDGIAPEHLPRLTERFYRADSARSRSLGGTGLGLAIVKHIVERHRGQLEIHSEPGEGTTVTVTLPRAPMALDEDAAAEAS